MFFYSKTFRSLLFLLALLILALTSSCGVLPDWPLPQPKAPPAHPAPTDARLPAVEAALQAATTNREDIVAFLIYSVQIERVDFGEDGKAALVWFALIEPESEEVIPGELSLALALQNEGT